ncbi:uncharacterized protein UHOD_11166 [Ustilago sp. UG-2017b]|nr:uncharacterized protein UHOD_11166 [Ustilago sp. UG-2017b]
MGTEKNLRRELIKRWTGGLAGWLAGWLGFDKFKACQRDTERRKKNAATREGSSEHGVNLGQERWCVGQETKRGEGVGKEQP